MPLFWLRVALSLYAVGLLYALSALWSGKKVLTTITIPAVGLELFSIWWRWLKTP